MCDGFQMPMKPETKLSLGLGGLSLLLLVSLATIALWGAEVGEAKERSEILHNLLVALGVVVGGGWVLFQFAIKRAYETALEINFSTTCCPHGMSKYMVFIDCALRNPASRKLGARAKRYKNGLGSPVFKDERPATGEPLEPPETLRHSVGLQIKRLDTDIPANTLLDWSEKANAAHTEDLFGEINLIESYEIPGVEKVHFWMEPGETYHLGTPVVLAEGRYLAMVTFIGSAGDDEFWRRVFSFSVPPSEMKGAGDEPSPSGSKPSAQKSAE